MAFYYIVISFRKLVAAINSVNLIDTSGARPLRKNTGDWTLSEKYPRCPNKKRRGAFPGFAKRMIASLSLLRASLLAARAQSRLCCWCDIRYRMCQRQWWNYLPTIRRQLRLFAFSLEATSAKYTFQRSFSLSARAKFAAWKSLAEDVSNN